MPLNKSQFIEMTLEELWEDYILSKQKEIRCELISRNMYFAENLAKSQSGKFDDSIYPIGDIICSAYMGLVKAFDKFNPYYDYKIKVKRKMNSQFLGWSSLKIYGEISEGWRTACWHNPRRNPAKIHKLRPMMFSTMDSYCKNLDAVDKESFDPEDKNPARNAEDKIDADNLYDDLYFDRIEELSEIDRLFLIDYFYAGKTINRIGNKLGLKEGAALGRQKTATRRLKKHLEKKRVTNETYSYANKNWVGPPSQSMKGLICH